MKRPLTAILTSGALAASVMAAAAPASAGPVTGPEMLTVSEVAVVYPELADAERIRSSGGITAPRAVMKDGHLRCDRYRSFRGTSRRHTLFFETISEKSVTLGQHVVRMAGVADAKGVLRHYRRYMSACEGSHATTDGEGGRARMVVRAWQAPRVGDGSVGLLVAFAQHGTTTWRRTLVARVGRSITVQEVEPYSGTGSADRLVTLSQLAVARLSG